MTPRPIEIIGGGLAGLTLGLALRRVGVDVTLFEAGHYPRHRVCGEFIAGLPPHTRDRLQLDPLFVGAALDHDVAWFTRASLSRIQKLPSPAFGLSRHTLDHRLATAFTSAGGRLHTRARAVALADAPGRVFATGRRRASSPWIGLKIHAQHLPLARDLEVHLGDQAYVGLARIENNQVNVCGLFRRRPLRATGAALLLAHLEAAELSSLARRLARAALDPTSFCAVAAIDFDRSISPTSEIRLGDACAMIAPFTGHGMAMAFQSAELALDPLLAYARGELSWPDTRRTIHAALHRRFRLRLVSARAFHPFLLRPAPQRCLALLNRARLLPLRPLYAALH